MLLRALALTSLLACQGAHGPAQSRPLSDEVQRAESLARNHRYESADKLLDDLECDSLVEEDRLRVSLGRARVSYLRGLQGPTETRLESLRTARFHYEDLLSSVSTDHPLLQDAIAEQADTCRALGSLVGQMVKRGSLSMESRWEAEGAFRQAAHCANQLYDLRKLAFQQLAQAQPLPPLGARGVRRPSAPITTPWAVAHEPLLILAAIYYEWAMIHEPSEFNYKDCLGKCTEYAETFVWEVVDESLLTTQVYLYDGLARLAMDDTDEALASLEMVIDPDYGAPGFMTSNEDLPNVWVNEITRMVEQACLALARHFNGKGEYERTEEFAGRLDAYYEQFRDWGTARSDQGDLVLLELGMAQYELGNASGRELLRSVARQHGNDSVAARAWAYLEATADD